MDNNATVEYLKVIVPAVIAVVGFGIGLWQYRAARRRQLLIDVQEGDKSTVGFVAMQVWNGDHTTRKFRWNLPKPIEVRREKRNTRRRQELFQALCLAAVFGKSGRSMSLIHGALASVAREPKSPFRDELRTIVDRATVAITRGAGYTDLQSGRRRLNSLRAALELDCDRRLRLDTYELLASEASRGLDRLSGASQAFIKSLEPAVKQQGSLVVVIPHARDHERVVSLGFDGAQINSAAPASETASAKMSLAKSGKPGEPSEATVAWLASRLVATIRAIPCYRDATVIASVKGTFSCRLGSAVANAMGEKTLVWLAIDRSKDPPVATPAGSVTAGDKVIVLDDVYRSGDTLQAAFKALQGEKATTVGGLTAICSVSPAAPPAVDRCGA